jgi:hypothetical protein
MQYCPTDQQVAGLWCCLLRVFTADVGGVKEQQMKHLLLPAEGKAAEMLSLQHTSRAPQL